MLFKHMELYEKIVPYVIAGIAKSKGLIKIKNDFSEAIEGEIEHFWEKVKPIFIKENVELTERIETNVQSQSESKLAAAKKDIEFIARSAIVSNEQDAANIAAALDKVINKFPSEAVAMKIVGDKNNTIVNSKVSNSFNKN